MPALQLSFLQLSVLCLQVGFNQWGAISENWRKNDVSFYSPHFFPSNHFVLFLFSALLSYVDNSWKTLFTKGSRELEMWLGGSGALRERFVRMRRNTSMDCILMAGEGLLI